MTLPIDRLTLADLPGCLDLAADRKWPREERKWRLLFELGTVFGIREPDGTVVGTTIVTRFGHVAAISMVLVAARHERRGFGRRLMVHALEHAGPGPSVLYATEYGRPLYERLGFTITGAVTAHVGRWRTEPAPPLSRAATNADRHAIAALDAAALGFDRAALLDRLDAFADTVRVVERDGALAGYGATWENDDAVHVGPVIAADETIARGLIADLGAGVDGTPVRVDLDHARPALRAWAIERGLAPRAPSVSMVRGKPTGTPERLFAPFMQALG